MLSHTHEWHTHKHTDMLRYISTYTQACQTLHILKEINWLLLPRWTQVRLPTSSITSHPWHEPRKHLWSQSPFSLCPKQSPAKETSRPSSEVVPLSPNFTDPAASHPCLQEGMEEKHKDEIRVSLLESVTHAAPDPSNGMAEGTGLASRHLGT